MTTTAASRNTNREGRNEVREGKATISSGSQSGNRDEQHVPKANDGWLEVLMKGLISDAASSIERYQRHADSATLLVPEALVDALVGDIDNLLGKESRDDAGNSSRQVLNQLADYMRRIQRACQEARTSIGEGERITEDEKRAKQMETVLVIQLLFDRRMTLIKMHRRESGE